MVVDILVPALAFGSLLAFLIFGVMGVKGAKDAKRKDINSALAEGQDD